MKLTTRFITRLALSTLVFSAFAGFVGAQEQVSPAAVGAPSAPSTSKATVYVFRIPHARTFKRNAPPVFCDEVLLAKLDRGRFFRIELDPGTHTFRSDRKRDGGVEIRLEADKTYYLRMEMEIGLTIKNVRLLVATPEESTYTIKQLDPVKPQDIKDPRVIAAF